jgi:hypothetical protein
LKKGSSLPKKKLMKDDISFYLFMSPFMLAFVLFTVLPITEKLSEILNLKLLMTILNRRLKVGMRLSRLMLIINWLTEDLQKLTIQKAIITKLLIFQSSVLTEKPMLMLS